MKQRIIVGLIALPLVLLPIWLGGIWAVLFFVAVAVGASREFYHMVRQGGYHPSTLLGILWTVALVLAYVYPNILRLSTVLMAGLTITLVEVMHEKREPMHTWMATGMGAIYLGILLGQIAALRLLPDGLWWVFFGLAVTWINDSAAYFTGVTVGRHKLWPRLSPKKTWEGTVAGWLAAALAGTAMILLTPLQATHSPLFGLVVGFGGGLLALLGDLAVSTLKRQVGVKDSGHFLPGHGGILDRLDSLLFVLPYVYQVVTLWG